MIRRRPRISRAVVPIVIRGAPFHVRTLHPPREYTGKTWRPSLSLDQIITVTLPAIRGLRHHEPVSCEVVL